MPLELLERILMQKISYALLLSAGLLSQAVRANDLEDANRALASKNDAQAVTAYRHAADQGSVEAQFALGERYEQGRGVAQDFQAAATWYRMAAEKGSKMAAFRLGWLYDTGRGVTQSFENAALWYEKASDGQDAIPEAQYSLGVLYELGRGVKTDPGKAALLYSFGSFKHFAPSELRLGWLHENDDGKPLATNRLTALHWHELAAEHGDALAAAQIVALKSGASASCEARDTEYSESQAVQDFPLKPGMWKIRSNFELKRLSAAHAEKKTCLGEMMVCVTRKDAYPTKSDWGTPLDPDGKPVPNAPTMVAITWPLQHIEYPIRLATDRRKASEDQYRYSNSVTKIPYWEMRDSDIMEDWLLERALYYQGDCAK